MRQNEVKFLSLSGGAFVLFCVPSLAMINYNWQHLPKGRSSRKHVNKAGKTQPTWPQETVECLMR